jgi:hypothetical protein
MTDKALFTMQLTDEQILDAVRIHRDQCAHSKHQEDKGVVTPNSKSGKSYCEPCTNS